MRQETSMDLPIPDTDIAREIAAAFSHKAVVKVRRFPAGLCHYVFEVTADDGCQFVVRIARPGNEKALGGYVYWESHLRTAGVPIARVLSADLDMAVFPFAYLVLERLEGTDLGEVYPTLSHQSKTALAQKIAEVQAATQTLPSCTRFGDALSYEDPGPHASWIRVIDAHIARCRQSVGPCTLLNHSDITRLEEATDRLARSLGQIGPHPFLDDITSNNVIVLSDGHLSGIIDVDTLCFGDSLFPLALTRAAFAKLGLDSIYTDTWAQHLHLTESSRIHLRLYSALFAAILLSEQGESFNRDTTVSINQSSVIRLRQMLETELQQIP